MDDDIQRNPYSLRAWLQMVQDTAEQPYEARRKVYEAALHALPMSYKIWRMYLQDAALQVKSLSPIDDARLRINHLFERCLVFLHKMPTIWSMYLDFLLKQAKLTETRRTFDRALQALPVTQHDRVWDLYIQFALESGVQELYVRVCRRYLMFRPAAREEHIQHLLDMSLWDEAVAQLAKLLDHQSSAASTSSSTTTTQSSAGGYSHFMRLCDVITRHPGEVMSVDVDAVLRSGIKRFSDEVGRLWCALAEYYVRAGMFDKARDIYEEAVSGVATVRDFATVFDAYVQFEETLLTAKLAEQGERDKQTKLTLKQQQQQQPRPVGAGASSSSSSTEQLIDPASVFLDMDDTDLRIARLELLVDRRALLLSGVLLRQNPHNVYEWARRCTLLQEAGQDAKVVLTYNEATKIVDPTIAVGKPHTLWVSWAKFYEQHGDAENARAVFRQATEADFTKVEDLANVWCEWCEMELRLNNAVGAHRVVQQAVTTIPGSRNAQRGAAGGGGGAAVTIGEDEGGTGTITTSSSTTAPDTFGTKRKVHRNVKLWGLYLDLEESLGTVATVKAAYDQVIQLRVATPQMVLNYAAYLEEKNHFEDSFRAYERGIAVLPWPHVRPVWVGYLRKFIDRYGSSKLERCRDLFEQVVGGSSSGDGAGGGGGATACPASEAFLLYSMYADFEERFGSIRHAMSVYDRATKAVDTEHLYELYLTYIRKAEEFFGAPRTRELFERAIEALPEAQVKDMCLRFAAMETKLGEIERARAIYTHAASFCDPAVHILFWKQWHEWEAKFGTEETFRDMLRVKRSITAQFATSHQVLMSVAGIKEGGGAESGSSSNHGAKKRNRDMDGAGGGGGGGGTTTSSSSSSTTTSGGGGAMDRFRAKAAVGIEK